MGKAGLTFLPNFFHDFQAGGGEYTGEHRPDWGSMSFLIDFLRPTASDDSSWFGLLKKAGGGCNDLMYSGHMLVAALTAMAWTVSSHTFLATAVNIIRFLYPCCNLT